MNSACDSGVTSETAGRLCLGFNQSQSTGERESTHLIIYEMIPSAFLGPE